MTLTQLTAASVLALATALPAFAHSLTFSAGLSGATETTPNNSVGTGVATLTIDEHALTMRVQASFSGLSGNATMTHIHCCTASAGSGNAGVASPLPSFPDFPAGVTLGSYDHTFDLTQDSSWNSAFVNANGGSTQTAFDALLKGLNEKKAYFNIHSSTFPGGELRGNFTAVVPEPGTSALMLVGLLSLAALTRRKG